MMYDRVISFGCLPALPNGFYVVQLDSGHYIATNDLHGDVPRDKLYESCITVNRFHARKWAFQFAAQRSKEGGE